MSSPISMPSTRGSCIRKTTLAPSSLMVQDSDRCACGSAACSRARRLRRMPDTIRSSCAPLAASAYASSSPSSSGRFSRVIARTLL